MRSVSILSILLLSFCLLNTKADAQDLLTEDISGFALKHTKKKKNYGLVVGVIHGDHLEIKGFGQMSQTQEFAPDLHTIFEIGSATQVFTTTLMMLQANAGKFNIEDGINDYLPADIEVPVYHPFVCRFVDNLSPVVDADEDYSRMVCEPDPLTPTQCITFCDLASHTSGLSNTPKGLYGWSPLKFVKFKSDPYRDFSREQLYRNLYKNELTIPPGILYNYSNSGMALLGNILADAAHSTFEDLLRENLLQKLQMHSTVVSLTGDQHKRFSIGHNKRGRVVDHWHFEGMAPAGGLRSTAWDLARFIKANLKTEEKALSAAFEQVHQPRVDITKKKKSRLTSGGYGWLISLLSPASNLPVVWTSGSTGGFSSFMGFNKDIQIGVVLLSNSANPVDEIGFKILQSLVIHLDTEQVENLNQKRPPEKTLD